MSTFAGRRYAVMGFVVVLATGCGVAAAQDSVAARSTPAQTEETRIDVFIPLNLRRPIIERELELHISHFKGHEGRETDVVGSVAVPLLPRWQIELEIPLVFTDPRDTKAAGGVGDIAVENKYLFYNSVEHRALVTGGFETRFPSGSERRGTGGETSIEPFLAAGTALGHLGLLVEVAYKFDIDSDVKGRRRRN